MKFTGKTIINQKREIVCALFADPKHLKHYQEGFISKELLEGEQGQDGAISRMLFKMGKGEMELIETITANRLPEQFLAHYHHKHMDNTMKCTFKDLGNSQTAYEIEVEYTRMAWIMPRLMAILFPSMYKKQGIRWMNNFKAFAENQTTSI